MVCFTRLIAVIDKMGLFDFLKKRQVKPNSLSLKKAIQRLIDFLPEYYKSHRQYANCIEFFEVNELGLALDSLSELALESEHFFSTEFWETIGLAADEMGMSTLSKTAQRERARVIRMENVNPYFGSTTQRIDETHYQHYIAEVLKDSWDNERWTKDKMNLDCEEGLHYKPNGRLGTFYYIESGRMADIYYELGSLGLIVDLTGDVYWSLPKKIKCTNEEIQKMKIEIMNFSERTGNAIDFS